MNRKTKYHSHSATIIIRIQSRLNQRLKPAILILQKHTHRSINATFYPVSLGRYIFACSQFIFYQLHDLFISFSELFSQLIVLLLQLIYVFLQLISLFWLLLFYLVESSFLILFLPLSFSLLLFLLKLFWLLGLSFISSPRKSLPTAWFVTFVWISGILNSYSLYFSSFLIKLLL